MDDVIVSFVGKLDSKAHHEYEKFRKVFSEASNALIEADASSEEAVIAREILELARGWADLMDISKESNAKDLIELDENVD